MLNDITRKKWKLNIVLSEFISRIYLSLGIRTWYYSNLQIVLNTPSKFFLKSRHQKILAKLPQKIDGAENFNPKKILQSSLSLKLKSTPK